MLTITCSGTRLLLRYLDLLAKGKEVPSTLIVQIAEDPGYKLFLRRWRELLARIGEDAAGLEQEDLIDLLTMYSRGRQYQGNRILVSLGKAMDGARPRLDELREILTVAEALEPDSMVDDVLALLPEGAQINATIYLLAEAHTNAYVHDGDVVVSFFHLATIDGTLFLNKVGSIQSTLKHELHHIGLESLQVLDDEGEEKTPTRGALGLIFGLLGEGSATLFFSPHTDGPLADAWRATEADLDLHHRDLEVVLKDLISEGLSLEDAGQAHFQRFFGPYKDQHMPAAYVLGVDMCKTIEAGFGRDALVRVLADPRRAFTLYNQAARKSGGYVYDDSLVEALEA